MTRKERRTLVGVVASDKMRETVTVTIERLVKHPLYKKIMRRRTKVMAHNEKNEARVGDRVELVETRPISRNKTWRVAQILVKAPAPIEAIDLGAPAIEAPRKTEGEAQS
jgi:small subunit ribosomal protein S17